MGKMSKEDKDDWDNLYEYVKKDILLYNDSQSIPKNLILRLRGLTTGKFIDNKNISNNANYSFKVVLYTFKICKPEIMAAIANKEFNGESHKFNFICRIVERNLNDVYERLQNIERTKENINTVNTEVISRNGQEYTKKTTDLKNKKLDELW